MLINVDTVALWTTPRRLLNSVLVYIADNEFSF